ncbi:putative uncharacterized protein FER1L6-AS1 [Symphalangus syndactylus]|uniref:putative uncharacterized protein FER1L6-AS1 n=1 Tax=Symphalangus syndactylus TaxID=9590 RepID=UPI0024423A80|nr:putative uncharacterized protein FER1L6-AS1 [Symphalangus syndactylus]
MDTLPYLHVSHGKCPLPVRGKGEMEGEALVSCLAMNSSGEQEACLDLGSKTPSLEISSNNQERSTNREETGMIICPERLFIYSKDSSKRLPGGLRIKNKTTCVPVQLHPSPSPKCQEAVVSPQAPVKLLNKIKMDTAL